MANSIRIAVDAMGGDHGPRAIVAALLNSLRKHTDVSALLFGDQHSLQAELSHCSDQSLLSRVEICHSDKVIAATEQPSVSIRRQRDSSMGMALASVSAGQADACVSAGNTAMLMALGLLELKTLPGISRPAICTALPTGNAPTYILDLGANVQCSAQQLAEFALLGSLAVKVLDEIDTPTVRLLNVGEESSKGNETVQQAAALLSTDPRINYCGFIEGDSVFKGQVDVVVCDGFIGNVALKSSEGAARLISQMLVELFRRNWLGRIAALLLARPLRGLKLELDPARYNGAYLLGLNGVVIKSHGAADSVAFGCALDVAIDAAAKNLPAALLPELQA
ncbi:MAG: phosphate acyltransferase PlsX [Porticoccaceae bacterium]